MSEVDLRAAVEQLRRALKAEEDAHDAAVDRAADAEAKVARVEALATDLERRAKGSGRKRRPSANRWAAEAFRLRAALAGPPSQHDGATVGSWRERYPEFTTLIFGDSPLDGDA